LSCGRRARVSCEPNLTHQTMVFKKNVQELVVDCVLADQCAGSPPLALEGVDAGLECLGGGGAFFSPTGLPGRTPQPFATHATMIVRCPTETRKARNKSVA